jgi:3-phosphoshikimate 1-carboxyvinyltransferase
MQVSVSAKKLCGEVDAVVSKSHMHRLLICAALGGGPAFIPCDTLSNDIRATAGCLAAMGLGVEYTQGGFAVSAKKQAMCALPLLDCGESGSTYRFLTPIVCAFGGGARLSFPEACPEPDGRLRDALEATGAIISGKGSANPVVTGRIAPGRYEIAGNVSSQYISG